MIRSEVLCLIEELSGDEHTWIDLKHHYPIDEEQGNEKKADFIKDIAAMANTVSLEPNYGLRFLDDDERYILVGVDNDTGDAVGTTEDIGPYTSLLDVDTAVPQNVLADYLTPNPDVEIHKFDETDPVLILLVIKKSDSPPVTIDRELGSELSRGDVYIRDGDRNRPARREDYQEFVQYHLKMERDYITDGIQQVVGMNIDYLRELGEVREVDSDEENAIPVSLSEEGPDIQSSLINPIELESVSRELNADVTKWRRRDRHSCSEESLYEYYLNASRLELTEEHLSFLTQSSWNNGHLGAFWVWKMDTKESLLYAIENTSIRSMASNQTRYLGELLAFLGSESTVERLVEYTGMNDSTYMGHGSIVLRSAEEDEPDRALRTTATTEAEGLEAPSWNLSEMDPTELIDVIETVCSELHSLAVQSPEITPSGLKGWMRNAETYLAFHDNLDDEIDERIREIFE